MLPNFLIIGAQKAGTTYVQACLQEHPEVFMPVGEVPFFEDPGYRRVDVGRLEALFDDASDEMAVGIKRPSYLGKPECPKRVYRHLPDARLLLVLRSPVRRAVSAYYHYMKTGILPIQPLETGMPALLDGKLTRKYPRSAEVLSFGLYSRHLLHYLNYFPREQMHIIPYWELRTDPLSTLSEVYRFLEVNHRFVPESLASRPQSGVYSLARLRLRRHRKLLLNEYSQHRTESYSRAERPRLVSIINKLLLTTDRFLLSPLCQPSKPKASDNVTRRLFALYQEDIAALEGLLGWDLDRWRCS